MSVNVTFGWGNLANNYCYVTPEAFKNDIFALLTGTIAGNFSGVIIGQNTPGVGDQDKAWIKTDSSGRPVGVFLYQGSWLWPNPRSASSNERIIWAGSEASLWSYDGGDGNDPVATPPTATTGAMWQRDTAFDFRIPMGVGTNGTTYDGNPATSIAQGGLAGEERHTLVDAEIPTYNDLGIKCTAGDGFFGSTDSTGTGLTGVNTFGEGAVSNKPKAQVASFGQGKSHQNLPPVIGVFYAKRTARIYLTA